MLKKFALFFAIIYSICLLAISLVRLDHIPKVEAHYADKIFHFVSYMALCFLWFSTSLYQFKFKKNKALVFAFVFSVLFGIIVEVLQSVFTGYRTFDFYDILANSVGVLIVIVLLKINKNIDVKIT